MKQLYMNFFVSLFLFCSVCNTAEAWDCIVDGIYYNLNGNEAAVTFAHINYNYEYYQGNIVIPSSITYKGESYTVTKIDNEAFINCNKLTSITIPNSVINIFNCAFDGCKSLKTIILSDGTTPLYVGNAHFSKGLFHDCALDSVYCGRMLTFKTSIYRYPPFAKTDVKKVEIGETVSTLQESSFKECQHLENVKLPKKLETLEDNVFEGCWRLKNLSLPNSVVTIGKRAFRACSSLNELIIPNSVTSIGNRAFMACSFNSITIPNSVSSIGDSVFCHCENLTSVIIGNGVTSISKYAFTNCTSLTSITIPNIITSIGDYAFYGCSSLTSVMIPNSVINIGDYAFTGCKSLASVTIGNSVESIGKLTFSSCTNLASVSFYCKEIKDWFQGMTSIKEVVIGNTVNSISSSAFKGCNGIEKISFYCEKIGAWFKGIESISTILIGKEVKNIEKNAFFGCSSLGTISIDADNKTYDSRNNCNAIIETSTNTLIFGCKGTDIPNGVAIIGSSAFIGCRGLTSVVIPNSVTSIGDYAFQGCTGLASATIGNSVTSIGDYAFQGCTGLTSATIGNSVTSIGDYAFQGCTGLASATIGNSVTSIGDYAFQGCTGLTSATIGNSVTSIGDYAFQGCTGLASATIGNSVTSIGDYAFQGCTGLTSVTIGDSVTNIGWSAFYGCTALTRVNITDLSAWCGIVFETSESNPLCYAHHLYLDGEELKDLVIPNSVESIGGLAFSGCTGLTSVIIPNSVESIGGLAFSGCTGLTSVTIGNNVESIGGLAFSGCTGLTSVTIGDNVTTILSNAFPANSNMKFYVNRGTKGLLTLWRYNYVPYDIVTNERLNKPSLSLKRTQTTHTISCPYYYDEYTYTLNNQSISEGEWVFTNLWPEAEYNYNLVVSLDDAKYSESKTFKTADIYPQVSKISSTASSLTIQGRYYSGDAQVSEGWLTIGGSNVEGQTATLTGLDPGKYDACFSIRVTNGSQTRVYTSSKTTISTETLSLVTQQPKVISAGNVIVAAKSNLDDAEENVGFEWRRTDWTDDFASNSGTAYLYEGTMEGYIRNLYTEKLWKYRPFYTSASGRTYYGEWVGIDPTNTSYFEPTVHTYSTIEVQGNTAAVRGYAMRGTDNISRQGFMYWPQGASHVGRRDAPSVPSNAMTIEATGTVMEAKLTGLAYNTTYSYVAFATTSEGETFYGDERQFTTDIDMSGIEEVEMSSDAATPETWYDLHGRRLSEPRHGINILRMSDGSSRKIFVP